MISISGIQAYQTQILQAKGMFLVDFWGPSCSPCIDLNRALEIMEADYRDTVQFVKINADDELDIAVTSGVRGLPTLLLIRDGVIIERWLGAITAKALKSKLDKALGRQG